MLLGSGRIARADYLCVESTHGNRAHRSFAADLRRARAWRCGERWKVDGGNVIIPAFVGAPRSAVRARRPGARGGRITPLDVVVDSPMASAVTALTVRHDDLWDDETRALRLGRGLTRARFRPLRQDVEESMALNAVKGGLVVISAAACAMPAGSSTTCATTSAGASARW